MAEAMGGCLSGICELTRGELAFFRDELAEAEKQLLLSIEKARKNQQYEIVNRSLFYLLRIHLSRGDAEGIDTVLKQLEAELKEPLFPNRHPYHDIVAGWYHIQTGRKERLAPWLKSEYEESSLHSEAQILEKLVKAKYYFSVKRYPAALAALESLGNTAPMLLGAIEIKALEAVCRYRLLNKEEAFAALGEAFALAAPTGLFMPFAELGKDMRALAEAAIKDIAAGNNVPGLSLAMLEEMRRNAAIYAKKLYRQSVKNRTVTGRKGGSILSYRETEVLIGLSRGLTREEIANAAAISPNTVKSAASSIYNKLGALNQADAVRIATEKGILP
jgi:LuxR family maltose regulon positive regulatory protein